MIESHMRDSDLSQIVDDIVYNLPRESRVRIANMDDRGIEALQEGLLRHILPEMNLASLFFERGVLLELGGDGSFATVINLSDRIYAFQVLPPQESSA